MSSEEVNVIPSLRVVVMFVLLAWLPQAFSQGAETRQCCWVILPDSEFRGLPGEFRGTVVLVRKTGEAITIKHDNRDIPFKFDAKRGTAQQRALLDTAKPGQLIRVRRVTIDGDVKYHLEPVR